MPELIEIYPFAVSLLIGLIVGIERERSHSPDTDSAGVRTFVLIGLLGALAVKLGDPLIAVVFGLFIASIVVVGYIRMTKSDPASGIGVTTEISAMCTYGLGLLSAKNPGLSELRLITTNEVSRNSYSWAPSAVLTRKYCSSG